MDVVDIAAELERVAGLLPNGSIRPLNAMLVGLGDTGQCIWHPEGERNEPELLPIETLGPESLAPAVSRSRPHWP